MKTIDLLKGLGLGSTLLGAAVPSIAEDALKPNVKQDEKPNILVIMGDDIGWFNISAYNDGMMGYKTPNIDKIANEGIRFTDAYAQQSSTAGRSAFITGQMPFRTGLLKVGLPGAELGIQKEDPTLAELLKPLGYTSGQFGKNHLGDKDEFLPTNHGFDEFYGNLYHLNAEEEPEHPDYPSDPAFREQFGPRGVIHSTADGPIRDTGPLTKKRMETIDEEVLDHAKDFINKAVKEEKPFFTWVNTSRMHVWTHLKKESQGVTGQGVYADGMVEHDNHVGELLQLLKELGIEENTIVVYATDNGAQVCSWPDGGTIPFRGEKNTTWEGAFRVPMMVKWPAKIKGGQISNDIISLEDWVPTLMAAAGDTNIKGKLLKGHQAGDMNYKVHLDGYNFLPYFEGKEEEGPRNEFYYFSDDGSLSAIRTGDWKAIFSAQESKGLDVWARPFTTFRAPYLVNLRQDPFERAMEEGMSYNKWMYEHVFMFAPSQKNVQKLLMTFQEYPPRQRPGSFTIDDVFKSIPTVKEREVLKK
ncbi:arylsulfatase [Sediminitomix flava]|uniref:Arylsulfatase n=1 Tax=Sediminitomix flava TaxID=379075 RepID=A0A315ZBP5_SEDFL|nr:arylsulfatase [Sediminitomix flava]PWJ42579.1 arylsulfatase [Sediminitomix flava]